MESSIVDARYTLQGWHQSNEYGLKWKEALRGKKQNQQATRNIRFAEKNRFLEKSEKLAGKLVVDQVGRG